jgi:hypothetical protein
LSAIVAVYAIRRQHPELAKLIKTLEAIADEENQ